MKYVIKYENILSFCMHQLVVIKLHIVCNLYAMRETLESCCHCHCCHQALRGSGSSSRRQSKRSPPMQLRPRYVVLSPPEKAKGGGSQGVGAGGSCLDAAAAAALALPACCADCIFNASQVSIKPQERWLRGCLVSFSQKLRPIANGFD